MDAYHRRMEAILNDLDSDTDLPSGIAMLYAERIRAAWRESWAAGVHLTGDERLDVDRLGRAMHIRGGHSNKYGGGRCRCWGEARALAGVYGNLALTETERSE